MKMTKEAAPSASMLRLAQTLFSNSAEQESFLTALSSGEMARPAILSVRGEAPLSDVTSPTFASPPWMPVWVCVPQEDFRAGADPRHAEGDWYLLDLSSVFCAAPLREIAKTESGTPFRIVVDVCASPGGKAVAAWRTLSPELLIANEAINGRIPALISNIKRCRIDPCVIVGRDPARLALELGSCADVVVVDAPCSGQSLLVKGKNSPGGFHPATVNMNAKRQRRILANSGQIVRPGGHLLYSTCTFSRAENEGVVEWFLKKFPEFTACPVTLLGTHRSQQSTAPCYRLFPFEGFGAGGFTCLLKRSSDAKVVPGAAGAHLEWNSLRGRELYEKLLSTD